MTDSARRQVIGIDDNLFMHRFTGPDGPGGAKEASNAKLSVRPLEENDTMTAAWVAPGLLMTASNEALVRFWKLGSNESYVLPIEDETVPLFSATCGCGGEPSAAPPAAL